MNYHYSLTARFVILARRDANRHLARMYDHKGNNWFDAFRDYDKARNLEDFGLNLLRRGR